LFLSPLLVFYRFSVIALKLLTVAVILCEENKIKSEFRIGKVNIGLLYFTFRFMKCQLTAKSELVRTSIII
jgi:hypothetical protein